MPSASSNRIVSRMLILAWCGSLLVCAASWFVLPEMAQDWAGNWSPRDPYSQFEARGAATAALWTIRFLSSLAGILLTVAWWKQRVVVSNLIAAFDEFWNSAFLEDNRTFAERTSTMLPPSAQATSEPSPLHSMTYLNSIRINAVRLMVVAWLGLAVYQAACSVQRRWYEWPVYGLRSGVTVLPNISESNRDVIRYLANTVPEDARVLVLSDQKLYFLSYYLLPRRVYHPIHPDSRFVIAQSYNARQLAAWRLEEMDPADIARLRPDYILEYFEGEKYFSGKDLSQDAAWVAFQKRRFGDAWRPTYLVALHAPAAKDQP